MRGVGGIGAGWGIAVVRIMTGLVFAVHGYQKFAGGIGHVAAFFGGIGVPLPGLAAPFISGLELVGGILLILGLATRWVGLLFGGQMLVTTLAVQIPSRGWDASDLDRMLLAAAVLLILAGPGTAALDEAVGLESKA